MKVQELIGEAKADRIQSKVFTIDTREMGELKLKVEFQHEMVGDPEDDGHAWSIVSIKLAQKYYDSEEKTYPKGFDATELPEWNERRDEEAVVDAIIELKSKGSKQ